MPGMRLALLAAAALAAWWPGSAVKITPVPSVKKSAAAAAVPIPCHDFYAYCREPFNSSRPSMRRKEGEKAGAGPPQNFSFKDYFNHRCFCDPDCQRYGDCCLDLVSRTGAPTTLAEFEEGLLRLDKAERREWECRELPILYPEQETNVYMLASCPAGYALPNILARCKRRVRPSEYDYTLDLPVLSQTTNITYANLYCAICNKDMRLRKWDVRIHCPPPAPGCTAYVRSWRYIPGQKMWLYLLPSNATQGGTEVTITYDIQNPVPGNGTYYQEYGARKCRKDVTGNCPDGWLGKERALCQSYSLVVKSQNTSKLYKNEYCAICNGESVSHLLCPKVPYHKPPVQSPPVSGTHSYAMLLDFMGTDGKVGEIGMCGNKELVCGFGELCDQLHQLCRVYTCGSNYQMDMEGKCIPSANKSRNANDLPFLDSNCPRFFVSSDRFVRLANNTVYINATRRVYNSSEYEVVNSSTILVCTPTHDAFSWKFSRAQSLLSKVCVTLSLVCLIGHITIHAITPQLRNLPGKNLLCLSVALFMAQFAFEFGVDFPGSFAACFGIALTVHFGFLASFFWMNIMAIDVCRTFATTTANGSIGNGAVWEFRKYSVYAWLTPFLLVMAAVLNDEVHFAAGYEPMYGEPLCWINNRQGLLVFFAVPLAILLVVNILFFTVTVTAICRTSQSTKFARKNSSAGAGDNTRMLLYMKLALIMGLTWVFGFVAALADLEVLWYLFIIFNCLQGAFIFAAFSCKKNIFRMFKASVCCTGGKYGKGRSGSKKLSDSNARSFNTTATTTVSGQRTSLSLDSYGQKINNAIKNNGTANL